MHVILLSIFLYMLQSECEILHNQYYYYHHNDESTKGSIKSNAMYTFPAAYNIESKFMIKACKLQN